MKHLDFKLIGQWIIIIGALIGMWIGMDRRVTVLEAGIEQEQKGYNVAIEEMNKRLDRLENKIDAVLLRAHSHGG